MPARVAVPLTVPTVNGEVLVKVASPFTIPVLDELSVKL